MHFFLLTQKQPLAESLQDNLDALGFDAFCGAGQDVSISENQAITVIDLDDGSALEKWSLSFPVRIGQIMDLLARMAQSQANDLVLKFGPYKLEAGQNQLVKEDGGVVKLTDTEKRLLVVLGQALGEQHSKDSLLQSVWQFRPDLETHTLETHIYRLRQKIEADPANPSLLLTKDDGYLIAAD